GGGQAMGALGGEQAGAYAEVVKALQSASKLGPGGVAYDPYGRLQAEGDVLALLREGQSVTQAAAGDTVAILLPSTPFYVASGGQISDTGVIRAANGGWRIRITDTQQPAAGAVVHIGEVL